MKRGNTSVRIDLEVLADVDEYAKPRRWRTRSAFTEEALQEKLKREKAKEARAE